MPLIVPRFTFVPIGSGILTTRCTSTAGALVSLVFFFRIGYPFTLAAAGELGSLGRLVPSRPISPQNGTSSPLSGVVGKASTGFSFGTIKS